MLYKMKTAFEEIVSVEHIGKDENPFALGELLAKACAEELPRAAKDKTRTLLLCVDMQRDFIEGGPLGVAGSVGDTERLTRFIYRNMTKITEIAASLDTHSPRQIFHQCWWRGADGQMPAPFTVITAKDVKEGRWRPLYEKEKSEEYLEYLETGGQKKLVIWPYHCIAGTAGCALENQFSNMIHFFSAAREASLKKNRQRHAARDGVLRHSQPRIRPRRQLREPRAARRPEALRQARNSRRSARLLRRPERPANLRSDGKRKETPGNLHHGRLHELRRPRRRVSLRNVQRMVRQIQLPHRQKHGGISVASATNGISKNRRSFAYSQLRRFLLLSVPFMPPYRGFDDFVDRRVFQLPAERLLRGG